MSPTHRCRKLRGLHCRRRLPVIGCDSGNLGCDGVLRIFGTVPDQGSGELSETERSLIAHAAFRESSEKFDHLVLAIIVAVSGFLVQTIPFGKVGLNVETMYLYSLILFGCSGLAAFKRTEWAILVHSKNHGMLDAIEKRDEANYLGNKVALDKCQKRTYLYYRARNIFIFTGFVCFIITKVFEQYVK
ncbi:hypothetical protein AB7M22_002936 [Pseudomonas sp. ADAK2 TE3594]